MPVAAPCPAAQVVLACFLATFTMYMERVGFSIAFAAMAKQAQVQEARMGQILSAFYWGYACSQVGSAFSLEEYSLMHGQRMPLTAALPALG